MERNNIKRGGAPALIAGVLVWMVFAVLASLLFQANVYNNGSGIHEPLIPQKSFADWRPDEDGRYAYQPPEEE